MSEKTTLKGSNQSLVKVTNQKLIIQEVREGKQLSRSDLAKKLQLSNPSVSKHVDDLLAKGLLIETGSLVTDVGRRPIMLEFNGTHGCVAVIDLSSTDARLFVADLLGNKLEYSRVDGGQIITAETLERIILTLHDMLTNLGERCGKLVGVCIGVPGVIEPETGRIRWSSRMENYETLDLKTMFEESFRAPVIVKNDVNLAVVGEQNYGAGVGLETMMLINIDAGIGMSVILGGKLYEGASGIACDIGVHMTMTDEEMETLTTCGDAMRYTLERRINVAKLTENVAEMMESGRETVLRDWVASGEELTFDDVVRAYGMNDPLVVQGVRRFARNIAVLCKNMCSLFDVETVMFGGAAAKLGNSFLNEITAFFGVLPGYSTAELTLSKLFDTGVIFGGVRTATDYAIDRIIANDSYRPAEPGAEEVITEEETE